MRFCSKCFLCKNESDFYVRKEDPTGYTTRCIKCISIANKLKYPNYLRPKKKKFIKFQGYLNGEYIDNRKQYSREYYLKEKDKIKQSRIEKALANQKPIHYDYYKKNKNKISKKSAEYYINNRDLIIKKNTLYIKRRKQTDPLYLFKIKIRKNLISAIKSSGHKKINKTNEILGIDYKSVMRYIESQFKKGMSWENHGKWHIDHIIPLASAKTEEEVILLCHYTNLQPLWAKDNLNKSAKILPTQLKMAI